MKNSLEAYWFSKLFALKGKMKRTDFAQIQEYYQWKFPFKSLHIVGTNGKGTIGFFLNQELVSQKLNVGYFSSPHLVDPCERIRINHWKIETEQIIKYSSSFQSLFPQINFGFFDLWLLCALKWFHDRQVDVAIFEAGIGAAEDVVNYLNHQITIFGTISLDHQAILGSTIEAIAKDKAQAIKQTNQIFLNQVLVEKQPQIFAIFKEQAKKMHNQLQVLQTDNTNFWTSNLTYVKAILKTAFAIEEFKSGFYLPPGRMQKIVINQQNCLLDVAHNLEAVAAILQFLKQEKQVFEQVVLSLSADKDYQAILALIEEHFETIWLYENQGRKPLKLGHYEPTKPVGKVYNLEQWLKKLAKPTLFIGSFYLAGEVLKLLNYEF